MLDRLKIKPRGEVMIKVHSVWDKYQNTIMPKAKEIVAKRLIEHPTSKIDKLRLYNGSVMVWEQTLKDTAILNLQQVQFNFEISAEAFSGTFDKVELLASAIGPFAELAGLQITKLPNEPLLISWKIKIL